MSSPTLIATLGLQPQIITRALDLLLDEHMEPGLQEVVIVHTAAFPYNHPHWDSLKKFKEYVRQRYPHITWRWAPIKNEAGETVYDVETPETAEYVFRLMYSEIRTLKRAGRRLHGLIAGGRKSMIVYTLFSAQLLFDADDRLWHLFSVDEGPDPHLPPQRKHHSRLIEIPVFQLASVMPVVHQLILDSEDPTNATALFWKQEDVNQVARLRQFYDECDPEDQRIIQLASSGAGNSEIAVQLGYAESTISRRFNDVARRFYTRGPGRRLPGGTGRLTQRLLKDMSPLLSKLPRNSD